MAQTNDNIILQKVSGNIGKQVVLKRVHGKTVLSKMPKKPAARSAKQQICAQGFKLATAYAKSVMQNPELKALYSAEAKRRGVINAYNMALVVVTTVNRAGNISYLFNNKCEQGLEN